LESQAVILENITKIFSLNYNIFSIINSLLETETVKQNKLIALENISFSVSKGEMIGIIGLNGSGKTTLLRIISGIYNPSSGKIQTNGKVAPLLQLGAGFQNELNAQGNIIMNGMLFGFSKNEIKSKVDHILDFAELSRFADMKLKNYSTGMRVRLAFSTALEINPDILLVDEILSVGDIGFREKSYKAFLSFKEKGKTIIFSSHNLKSISELSDRVILLNKGQVEAIGKPDDVINTYRKGTHSLH